MKLGEDFLHHPREATAARWPMSISRTSPAGDMVISYEGHSAKQFCSAWRKFGFSRRMDCTTLSVMRPRPINFQPKLLIGHGRRSLRAELPMVRWPPGTPRFPAQNQDDLSTTLRSLRTGIRTRCNLISATVLSFATLLTTFRTA
jgi:hypothetical protein